MASGAIGGYTFASFSGEMCPGNGVTIEEITRPGVSGVAYRQVGSKGEASKVSTVADVSSAALAAALITAYRALQGTQVAVTDGNGITWSRVIVVAAKPGKVQAARALVGGLLGPTATGWLVPCDWVLQVLE